MNISFIPESCKGEAALFEGSLVIRMPTADERCDYLAEANINFEDLKVAGGTAYLKPVASMMRSSYEHIVKIDLKKKADGKKITTVDDLKYDNDCFGILSELATKMTNGGFLLGKTSP